VLNQAGSEGWDLVAVTGNRIAYLKREIVQPAKLGRLRQHRMSDASSTRVHPG
jgi:hypothetical protein